MAARPSAEEAGKAGGEKEAGGMPGEPNREPTIHLVAFNLQTPSAGDRHPSSCHRLGRARRYKKIRAGSTISLEKSAALHCDQKWCCGLQPKNKHCWTNSQFHRRRWGVEAVCERKKAKYVGLIAECKETGGSVCRGGRR